MSDAERRSQLKACCATFYEGDLARLLLGEVFHPGGLALTTHLGETIGLKQSDHVLDVACGRGLSAVDLAEVFGCRVTGIDYGGENVAAAQALAQARGLAERTAFRQADAEGLPFADGGFDAVIVECSFCTFPNKKAAAAEMARVLRPGGRVALTDMTVSGSLPHQLHSLLSWVACISGAGRVEDYVAILGAAGFEAFVVEDQRQALLELVTEVRRRLLVAELAVALKRIDLGGVDLPEAKGLATLARELIEDGTVGYALVVATKAR